MKNIKKIILIMLTIVMAVSLIGCQTTSKADGGVFTGESKGKNGLIKVKVTIENSVIKDIEIVENHESEFTKEVFDQVPKNIIAANSVEIDTITGATLTSAAIIEAVADAVKKSGIKLVAKDVQKDIAKIEDVTTDVVVIGGGGAGLTAAIEAKENGANVILVEKNPFVGGNTNFATGGLNAAGTKYQKDKGIEDSPELFYNDTMKGGYDKNDPELVKVLTENAAQTVEWLTERGADLSDVGRMAGASVDRTHRPTGGASVGAHLVSVLEKRATEVGVDIRVDTKAVELLGQDNKVTGITVEDKNGNKYSIHAKAVIIATGGFGASQDKVVQYQPELKGFGTTNHPGATGDALDLIKPFNVELVDMTEIQTHPTVVPSNNEMITEAVRGNGAILVNRDGKRFVNELETRDVVSEATLEQQGQTAFLVFDQSVRESLKAIEKYHKSGLLTEKSSVKELADAIGANAAEFEKTIAKYNGYVAAKQDKDFGRSDMPRELNKGPFYAVEVGPAVHHTMGGIKINTNAQVINTSGNSIEGLFAAGEVTGGVHGGNRLGGNALADITTFGRIAGKNAAESIK